MPLGAVAAAPWARQVRGDRHACAGCLNKLTTAGRASGPLVRATWPQRPELLQHGRVVADFGGLPETPKMPMPLPSRFSGTPLPLPPPLALLLAWCVRGRWGRDAEQLDWNYVRNFDQVFGLHSAESPRWARRRTTHARKSSQCLVEIMGPFHVCSACVCTFAPTLRRACARHSASTYSQSHCLGRARLNMIDKRNTKSTSQRCTWNGRRTRLAAAVPTPGDAIQRVACKALRQTPCTFPILGVDPIDW